MALTDHPDRVLPITEDEARVALARATIAGGYDPTRIEGGWMFTPPMRADIKYGIPWLVGDDGTVRALTPAHSDISSLHR